MGSVEMNWYVLFAMTGYEHQLANVISRVWRIDGLRPFVPMYDTRFRKAGNILEEKKQLIPGYIFLESKADSLEFYSLVRPFIWQTEKALKLLRYGHTSDDFRFDMKAADCEFLQKFFNDEYCVEMSQGYMEGNSVIITDGPMIGLEGIIKRLYRRKMEAVVEAPFMGTIREMTVGLEIVKKIP